MTRPPVPRNDTGSPVPQDMAPPASPFTTRAQAEFRGSGRRRMLWAGLLALAALVAVIVFGPDEQEIKERFEYYGAPGEMRIMEEISIDDGRDAVEQLPQSLRMPPPPAHVEVEEEDSPDGVEPVPEEATHDSNEFTAAVDNPQEDAESAEDFRVEMSLPQQTSETYHIIELVRPEYPLDASELERRTPVITVRVGIFVDAEGNVAAVMILASNGSPVFERAVREALEQWKFAWIAEPSPRWLQFPINFKSPYFTSGR